MMTPMDTGTVRETLDRLIRERGVSYEALSRLLGRNPAYVQQFVKRGTPRKLDEADRRVLARYFGVDERMLGASDAPVAPTSPAAPARKRTGDLVIVPRFALGASAGPGALVEEERAAGVLGFDPRWLRAIGGRPDMLSMIRVDGESMAPTLSDGDEIMVDRSDGIDRLRDGIYVLRMDDVLMVKRVALAPRRGGFSVRSDNPLYPAWDDVDADAVSIVGRVIWAGRRLG
ncbi:peptidase S24 family protein [Sphingobium sp. SYK-6]|uniref:S24 family peptidase n=1 Tax=Sphingobium sp. (strain NBRC 103272 / SYK-6) TaxID=627192 RepID=UPI0002277D3C|nr:peptidase S24 family protein [Sphingobium sp. SYK-6]